MTERERPEARRKITVNPKTQTLGFRIRPDGRVDYFPVPKTEPSGRMDDDKQA